MEEQELVVNPEESTTPEEAVVQEVASLETAEVETQAPTEVGEPRVDDTLDEFGVPWKNRAMEWKRKAEKEREERENSIKAQQVQQQPQREYTIAELETFALETDNPEHKRWAISEAEKIRERKFSELTKKEIEGWKQQQLNEQIRNQTVTSVIQRNPDLVIKDANGNFKGWNASSPKLKLINQYMQNPEISSHPKALEIAEAFAIRDISSSQTPAITKTIETQKNALKNLQKKTLVEGGGSQNLQQMSGLEAAKNKVYQSGAGKDAKEYLKHYFTAKGVLSE